MRFASERSLNAIKLRKISPLLVKEGPEVVKKVNSIQIVNYHPPTPSLVRRERIWLNLMAVERSLESSDDVFRLRLYPPYAGFIFLSKAKLDLLLSSYLKKLY